MAPEYGATCGIFPIDSEAIVYLRLSGRSEEQIALVEAYAKAQQCWHDENSTEAEFSSVLELDLTQVRPSMAGPKRPQDRVLLGDMQKNFESALSGLTVGRKPRDVTVGRFESEGGCTSVVMTSVPGPRGPCPQAPLRDGAVVIAASTSCTNTSNPAVMIAAGLLARNAAALGLNSMPWVKPSLGPGSLVVTDYLKKTGLLHELEKVGFFVVGYGCTTCIGNSGPLPAEISKEIAEGDLAVTAVLSGNRNFEGRVHPEVKLNYLASPPLVVAYALAGTIDINLDTDPLGSARMANRLSQISGPPTRKSRHHRRAISPAMFKSNYADVFKGDSRWNHIVSPTGTSTHGQLDVCEEPSLLRGHDHGRRQYPDIHSASVLGLFGDSITTDHISPAGSIKKDSPAGQYLISRGVQPKDFNSYGSRRGNDDVMVRGTFANIRIRNLMLDGVEGGFTVHIPSAAEMPIYDAAMKYKAEGTPLVVIAGKEYGTGSSRDWAAKGTLRSASRP